MRAKSWAALWLCVFLWMACLGQTGSGSGIPWFFQADGIAAGELAVSISERFGVSVVLRPELSKKTISGRLVSSSVVEAVETLAFLVGAKARRDYSGSVWFVGGSEEKVVRSFPGYGLQSAEILAGMRDGVTVLGGRVVVEAEAVRAAQIGDVLASFSNRLALTVELVMLDVASNQVERVNAWLDRVNVGAGYVTKAAAAVAAAGPAVGGAAAVLQPRGWNWDVELSGLFAMLDVGDSARVELRQQASVLSGSKTRFESGEVIETPLIVREPQTGRDLVSSIDRRTVGLVVTMGANHAGGSWVVDLDVQDGSLSGGREVRTGLQTQAVLRMGSPVVMLGSYTRATEGRADSEVPVLGRIPKLGKHLFRKSITKRGNRSVVILARPIMESAAGQ